DDGVAPHHHDQPHSLLSCSIGMAQIEVNPRRRPFEGPLGEVRPSLSIGEVRAGENFVTETYILRILLESLRRHAGVFGTSGSGKTFTAMVLFHELSKL